MDQVALNLLLDEGFALWAAMVGFDPETSSLWRESGKQAKQPAVVALLRLE